MSAHILLPRIASALAALLVSSVVVSSIAMAQTPTGTAFTYQGRLTVAGSPASGSFDLSFTLYGAQEGGFPVAFPSYKWGVPVQNGVLSVDIDFGTGAFEGAGRWLEMGVKPAGSEGDFTTLVPRQPVNPMPYALYSLSTGSFTLPDGSVTTAKLADSAVTTAKLGSGVVGTANLADAAVTASKLTNGAVTTAKLGTAAVTSNELADGAVTGSKLANGAVTTGKLAPLSVSTSQLTDAAVTSLKLADGAVIAGKLGARAVSAAELGDAAVTTQKLGDLSVMAGKLADRAVTTAKLAVGAVTSNELASGSVTVQKLGDLSVMAGKLADGAVTTAKLAGGAVTSNELANGSVTAQKISGAGGAAGQVLTFNGGSVGWANPASSWGLSGNSGTTSTNFIGTTDTQPLELRVNGARMLRLEPGNLIGGSFSNSVTSGVRGATIAGGGDPFDPNKVTDDGGTVGGGTGNRAGDALGTTTDAGYATVGGGWGNYASGRESTVAGGLDNLADGEYSFVGGGRYNEADGVNSVISGGSYNEATGTYSVISGGSYNHAVGAHGSVPGGYGNYANGDYSFAAGRNARAMDDGSFVLADSTGDTLESFTPNEFRARFSNGFVFFTNTAYNSGARLTAGSGAWSALSDRNAKTGISAADAKLILQKLVALPVATWSYNSQDESIRHIGPMAQDFAAAFGLGEDDRYISTVDADGVALAAIKGLYETVQEKEAAIASVQQQNAAKITSLQQQNAALEARLAAMEKQLQSGQTPPAPAGSELPIGLPLAGGIVLSGLALRSWKPPFGRR